MEFKEQVEKIGIELSWVGFPPIVSRIIGFLLLANPPCQSFYQIQEFLSASKSAISYAINYLLNNNDIETVTFPGDRKRYFKLREGTWISIIKKALVQLTSPKNIFKEIAVFRQHENPEQSRSFMEISQLYELIEKKVSESVEDWEKKRTEIGYDAKFFGLMNRRRNQEF